MFTASENDDAPAALICFLATTTQAAKCDAALTYLLTNIHPRAANAVWPVGSSGTGKLRTRCCHRKATTDAAKAKI
ncbi:hypothetical protein PR003_g11954 [Phytophthora rubi]|uniref:Uncharacterized protein n=1 Tax=Phytophthora rubi TaxID=129364 RepID=A0A6A4F6M6_9STRA|nr:hypothetical protein PR002_g11892 [Phytophthora rubi]KAE9034042.1 hypothetical protein PR001_g9894 [Phytophthora rubi]KAE9337545.1 hypothetical protein PR003_g11954 [Phytophthora rubi]